jgi:UDP-glucose:(heptosyl)LPS alpha-1,3-glucosyltransferase
MHEQGSKAYLVVIGKGENRYVRGAIKRAGLEDFIIFKGLVNNVAHYYQAADVMILLTRYDPFSNACLEALACGCPVITTRNNGVAEVMKSFSGLIIDDVTKQNVISHCGNYIMQQKFSAAEISESVSHLLADKEKNAHLEVINRVFAEKN